MNAIHGIWKDGKIQLQGQVDWPEGMRLIIRTDPQDELTFLSEDEQSDDPVEIERWIQELRSLPPVDVPHPADDPEWRAWEERMAQYNLDAVRKQFSDPQP